MLQVLPRRRRHQAYTLASPILIRPFTSSKEGTRKISGTRAREETRHQFLFYTTDDFSVTFTLLASCSAMKKRANRIFDLGSSSVIDHKAIRVSRYERGGDVTRVYHSRSWRYPESELNHLDEDAMSGFDCSSGHNKGSSRLLRRFRHPSGWSE